MKCVKYTLPLSHRGMDHDALLVELDCTCVHGNKPSDAVLHRGTNLGMSDHSSWLCLMIPVKMIVFDLLDWNVRMCLNNPCFNISVIKRSAYLLLRYTDCQLLYVFGHFQAGVLILKLVHLPA